MLVLMYIAVISPVRPTHYYSTVLTFVFGVVYSKYREQIEAFLKQHYWTMLSVVGSAFVVVYYLFRKCEGVCYNGLAILFVLLIVIVSLKIKIGNPILGWLGAHLFPIYLYHPVFYRLYLHYFGAPSLVAVILFLLVSFAMTFMIAHLYKYWKYEPSSSVKC